MSKGAPSARGLFRATGKKPKPVAVRNEDGSYAKAPQRERQKDDFEETPREATRAFVTAELQRLIEFETIWEPAAGKGAIARVLEEIGLHVRLSDLVDRGLPVGACQIKSFYNYDFVPRVVGERVAIVTNPPFQECSWGNAKARWISHAIDTLRIEYMALLLPLSWACAGGMKGFYEAHKPARIYPMAWRLDFTGQGAQPAQHAWYVWDSAYKGETIMRILYRGEDGKQGALFGA